MAGQAKQTSRNRKIEPLNWAEAAKSPALKGMMSFLDIKPEEVRSGHFNAVPTEPGLSIEAVSETHPGSETHTGGDSLIADVGVKPARPMAVVEIRPKHTETGAPLPVEAAESLTIDLQAVSETLPVSVSLPVNEQRPMAKVVFGSTPSQNRKIRKCRLSQDAHSAGEETLYRILWEEGKPDPANPLGSRTVRIGYAELANKARMHKVNVRLNLANLTAKLAIEQCGDFNSREMIAKLYRVLSYKEILERRRAAGLEYVIRQKNVIFVTPMGIPIPLPGLTQRGKGKVSRKAEGPHPLDDSIPVNETQPVSESLTGSETETDFQADMECVSKALNTYWTVDDAAAVQLIRACRTVRPDAQAEEIAFFVREKLELTRGNRSIVNPVGLILATVPQSFEGYSFVIFRQRRQQRERLAEEERLRKVEEDRKLMEWVTRDARQAL
jgi:hypothetical protein